MFDSGLTIPGPKFGDREIEIVGTDGPTHLERLDYLQRHVGKKFYPWIDMGTHFTPRLELKGHQGGRASSAPADPDTYEQEDLDLAESVTDPGPNIVPAEVCYLDSTPTPARFGLKRWHKPVVGEYPGPVTEPPPRLPNTHWIMTERGWQRGLLNQRPWHKPTYEETDLPSAELAAGSMRRKTMKHKEFDERKNFKLPEELVESVASAHDEPQPRGSAPQILGPGSN